MGNIIVPMWAQCPALTRILCVGYPALSVALMILGSTAVGWLVRALFVCNVHSVMHLRLWTLCLGPFFTPVVNGMSFVSLLFEVYMAMMYFPPQEQELGSSVMLFWTFIMNALVNVAYLLLMLLFSLVYRGSLAGEAYLESSSSGLWPLIMLSLTIRCLGDPQGSTSFWGFAQIPNRWYPLCLTAFFCLLSGMRVLWNVVAALAIGYSYGALRYERLLPSRLWVGRLEERCCSDGACGLLGASWVPAAQTPGFQAEAAGRRRAGLGGGSQLAARGRAVQPSSGAGGAQLRFEAFSGSGSRLGDGADLAQPLAPAEAPPQAPAEAPLERTAQEAQPAPAAAPGQGA